jgi:predicted RNase H-like nuclease (RuvC/YqgF family)
VAVTEDLKTEVSILKRQLDESDNARTRLERDNDALRNEINVLRKDLKTALQQKSIMQDNLEESANTNITMEEKVYKSNKISLELMKEVKDLQNKVHWLETQFGIYTAVKNDPVDLSLAHFINNQDEQPQLKTLFVREAPGVYNFGTKKVNVKTDAGKLKVRVGGGWLSIEEFTEQHLPLELEKVVLTHKYSSPTYDGQHNS